MTHLYSIVMYNLWKFAKVKRSSLQPGEPDSHLSVGSPPDWAVHVQHIATLCNSFSSFRNDIINCQQLHPQPMKGTAQCASAGSRRFIGLASSGPSGRRLRGTLPSDAFDESLLVKFEMYWNLVKLVQDGASMIAISSLIKLASSYISISLYSVVQKDWPPLLPGDAIPVRILVMTMNLSKLNGPLLLSFTNINYLQYSPCWSKLYTWPAGRGKQALESFQILAELPTVRQHPPFTALIQT